MGFGFDEKGSVVNKLDPIKLGRTTIAAKATKDVTLSMNLDSRANKMEFNIEQPEKTSNFSNSMTVYDNVGTARTVTVYYNKTDNNQWEYHVAADGKDVEGGKADSMYEQASGKLKFNDKGQLEEKIEGKNAFNFNKGAAKDQKINFAWGQTLKDGGTGLDASSQYGSDSSISRGTQDGATAATLTSLSFNDKGILTAVYNNGESKDIAQISIAKFENNEGLFKIGKNLFKDSKSSGQPTFGKPGDSGRGEVLSKSIELSNVDIANEFVNLMTAQRNFQANAKTLTTADQMLQEVLQIKR
jgi:flagellar hook protein FlgE